MFTGIIQAVGEVESLALRPNGARLRIHAPAFDGPATVIGDSIAVNGACLTVAELNANGFAADLSPETLARTTLGALLTGSRVNLEPALRLGDRLGGHLVSGHVDGIGSVVLAEGDAAGRRLRIRAPQELARYIARKGSVCVDGASLTVNEVAGSDFELTLVPHTLAATTLGEWTAGRRVNLEVDLIARYLERLTAS